MPDKLLIKNRKLVVRNRKLLTTKDGAECCCGDPPPPPGPCCPGSGSYWGAGFLPGEGALAVGEATLSVFDRDRRGVVSSFSETRQFSIPLEFRVTATIDECYAIGEVEIPLPNTPSGVSHAMLVKVDAVTYADKTGFTNSPHGCIFNTFPPCIGSGTQSYHFGPALFGNNLNACSPSVTTTVQRVVGQNISDRAQWWKSLRPDLCDAGGGIIYAAGGFGFNEFGSIGHPTPSRTNGQTETAWNMAGEINLVDPSLPSQLYRVNMSVTLDIQNLVDCPGDSPRTTGPASDPRCGNCNAPVMAGVPTCLACGFRLDACLGCGL